MTAWYEAAALAADRLDPPAGRITELADTMSPEHRTIAARNMTAAVAAEADHAGDDPSGLTPEGRLAWAMLRTWMLCERSASTAHPVRRALPPECGRVYLAEPEAQPWGVCDCGLLIPSRLISEHPVVMTPYLDRCPSCDAPTDG